jgi:hypothetical protein
MKRFLAIPLMFIYLLAMSGIMVNAHFCGSKLVSWNVYLRAPLCGSCADDNCTNEGKKPMKCCKDKVVVAKVQQDQKNADFYKLQLRAPVFTAAILPLNSGINYYLPATPVASLPSRSNAPPGNWQAIPLYKLHSCFTYYG